MARVKGAMMARKRRNKTLKLAKGYSFFCAHFIKSCRIVQQCCAKSQHSPFHMKYNNASRIVYFYTSIYGCFITGMCERVKGAVAL